MIVVAGAGILDVLVYPANPEVFRTGSEPMQTIRLSTGGDALNEATILARLGKETELITLLGEDDAADMIRLHCSKEGISLALTQTEAGTQTGINVVLVQQDGSRSFLTNPESSLRRLSLAHMPARFPEGSDIFCLASMFISPLLGNPQMRELFCRAKRQGLTVCADMTKCRNRESARKMKELLSCLDYLFANEEEAALLTGRPDADGMAEELVAAGVTNAVIKRGADGCLIKGPEGTECFPAVPGTDCVDTTGAGDAFAAGFLCALEEHRSLEECAAWANACGSLATEAVGSAGALTDRSKVETRLRRLT